MDSSIPKKRLEAHRRSKRILWQSPKHWISPKQEVHYFAKTRSEALLSAWIISDSSEMCLQKIGKEVVEQFRLSRVTQRFVQGRGQKGHALGTHKKVDKMVEARTLCRVSNFKLCGAH